MDQAMSSSRLNTRTVWGIIIVIIGLLFLLQELGLNIQAGKYWPIVLLIPGLAFWSMFLSRRQQKGTEGVLIPGTILTLLGAYFMVESLTNYSTTEQTSFIYTLIVGLAFFAAYYFGDRSRGYMIPAWILLGVSALILLSANAQREAWPIILIIIGIWLIVRPSHRKNRDDAKSDNNQPENHNSTVESK